MPTPEALLMASLAMDVYSRGYNAALSDGFDNTPDDDRGEDGLGENSNGTQTIGPAKVFWTLNKAGIYDTAEDIGFHAIAYQLTEAVGSLAAGTVVIAYRGTDNLDPVAWSDGASDVWQGYGLGLGAGYGQTHLAGAFLRSVREEVGRQAFTAMQEHLVDPEHVPMPTVPEMVTTGHSLGGGLSGFMSGIYGVRGFLFDYMPFQDMLEFEFARSIAEFALGTPNMWGLDGVGHMVGDYRTRMEAFHVSGEFLETARAFPNYVGYDSVVSESLGAEGLSFNKLDTTDTVFAHSAAFLTVLMKAKIDGNPLVDPNHWLPFFKDALTSTALVDADMAAALGYPEEGDLGRYDAASKFTTLLAYTFADPNRFESGSGSQFLQEMATWPRFLNNGPIVRRVKFRRLMTAYFKPRFPQW